MGKKKSYLYRWTLEVTWEQSGVIFYVIYISDGIARWKGRIQKGSHTSKCLLQTIRNCFQIQLVCHTWIKAGIELVAH